MKPIRYLALVVAIISIAACTTTRSTGVAIDQSQLSQLQRGKTTYNDVVARFGQPTSSMTTADGIRMISYSASNFHQRVIPFAGGAPSVDASTTTFKFAPNGTLSDYTSSSSNTGSTTTTH